MDDMFDPSAPSGKIFPASDYMPKRLIFVLPIKPGEAPLSMFDNATYQALVGHPDIIFSPDQVAYRRTKRFLFMGGTPETILPYGDQTFTEYADPSLMAMVKGNFELLRTKSPFKCAEVIADWTKLEDSLLPNGTVNDLIRNQVDSVEMRFYAHDLMASIQVNAAVKSVRPLSKTYPRPALPENCFARFEYCFSSREEIAQRIASFLEFFSKRNPPASGTEKTVGDYKTIFSNTFATLLGDATSIALERTPEGVVTYAIMQYAEPKDLDAELTKLKPRIRQLLNLTDDNLPWTRSTYDDGPFHVLRLLTGDRKWYCDFIQRDNKVTASLSQSSGHYVGRIAALKPIGQTMHLASASCTLPELKRFVATFPGHNVPALAQEFIDQYFGAGHVAFDLDIKEQAISAEIQFPAQLLVPLLKAIPF